MPGDAITTIEHGAIAVRHQCRSRECRSCCQAGATIEHVVIAIIIPIGIIVMGSLDFLKATIAGDSDKMKKNQKQFVTRLIAGAITFFVFVVVKFVVSMVADTNNSVSFTTCLDCLINDEGSCDTVATSPFESK